MKPNILLITLLTPLWMSHSAFAVKKCGRGLPSPKPGSGTVHYVSPAGDDTKLCTKAQPCREVRRVLALLKPGHSVRLADGHYQGFTVSALEGTASEPIAFIASGKEVHIDPTRDRTDNRDTIQITMSKHLIFDGLNVANARRAGLRVDHSHFVTVRNGVFADSGYWGIFTNYADDVLLEHNTCYGSKNEHGIYISDSSQRPTVRFNRLYENRTCGLHMNGGLTIGPPGYIRGAHIEGNTIYRNGRGGGAGINMDGVQDSVIVNNLLYDNTATGIVAFKDNGAEGPRNLKIINNTVLQDKRGRHALQLSNTTGPIFVRNNFFFHPAAAKAGIDYDLEKDVQNTNSDYNFVDRIALADTPVAVAEWRKRFAAQEEHSQSHPPELSSVFVDVPKANFHLAAKSPARAKGVAVPEITADLEGGCRDAVPSIGAYQ